MSFYDTLQTQQKEMYDSNVRFILNPNASYYFSGYCGAGKSTQALLHARNFITSNSLTSEWQDQNMEFIRFTDFVTIARKSFGERDQAWSNRQRIKDIMKIKYLILDDIGTEKQTEYVNQLIYELMEARYTNDCITVMTSNYCVEEIKEKYGDRISSRITGICGEKNCYYKKDGVDHRLKAPKRVNLESIFQDNIKNNLQKTPESSKTPKEVKCTWLLQGINRTNPKMIQDLKEGKQLEWLQRIVKYSGLETEEEVEVLLEMGTMG